MTISCSSDPDMAKALFDFLQSNLNVNHQNDIILETDEIFVKSAADAILDKKTMMDAIRSFTRSKHDYENCQVTKFDDMIIVGVPVNTEQLIDNLQSCDMCDYRTPYQEQLWLHRMTHGNVFLG